MTPMSLVRLISCLPITHRMRRHMIDCAAYAMIDRRLKPWLPYMTWKHVVGLKRLPLP